MAFTLSFAGKLALTIDLNNAADQGIESFEFN